MTITRLLAALFAVCMMCAPVAAQNTDTYFGTPGGGGVNGSVGMCLNASSKAVPCSDTSAQISVDAATVRRPILVTTGNTYQVALAAATNRRSLTIQNNNATDNCLLLIGGPWVAGDTTATSRTDGGISIAAAKASILLLPGGSYTRYFPYIPSDQILGTCTTTADSIYTDTQ